MFITAGLHGLPWLMQSPLAPVVACLGIAGGLCLALAPSPFSRWWCMWLWGSCALAIAFHWSPAAMAYTLSSEYWLGLLVAAPLILWDGLRLALGYWLAARICRQINRLWLPAGLITVALEESMPGVFPWRLGLTQLEWPWWLQAVDILGAGWATLLAFAAAGLSIQLACWLKGILTASPDRQRVPDRWPVLVARYATVGVLGCNAIYCAWAWSYWQKVIETSPSITVGLVQVDPSYKESHAQLQCATLSIADRVDLVIWPESSAGTYDLALDDFSDQQQNFRMSRAPDRGLRPWPQPSRELLLAGKNYRPNSLRRVSTTSMQDEEFAELFVSAMLLDKSEQIAGRYHKRFLMPFGEYVPFENIIPGLAQLFDMCEHVTPGQTNGVLCSSTGARVGVMLCYEDMVRRAAEESTANHANVLVSLINGSAFENTYTLLQHRMLAHLRSIENRRTLIRCAATGQSCIISARGEIASALPLQTAGTMCAPVALIDQPPSGWTLPWLAFSCIGYLALYVCSSAGLYPRPERLPNWTAPL